MAANKLARRYAKAIAELYTDPKQLGKILSELKSWASMMQNHPDLKLVFSVPSITMEQRQAVLKDLCDKAGYKKETFQILATLAPDDRILFTAEISEKLHLSILEKTGGTMMSVVSAADLTANEKEKIESKFSKLFNTRVEPSYETNAHLLGGFVVQAKGHTFDSSLKGQLERLSESLVGGN